MAEYFKSCNFSWTAATCSENLKEGTFSFSLTLVSRRPEVTEPFTAIAFTLTMFILTLLS